MTTGRTSRTRTYRGENREVRHGRRRAQLLDAAKAVFGDHGFRAAKVRQICAEAGLTERYFYQSFENPAALFEAVYDRELEVLKQRLDAVIASGPSDPAAMAHALIKAYYSLLRADPRLARILVIEVYGTASNMGKLYRRGIRPFANTVGKVLAKGMDLSVDSRLDAELLATALIGAASHLAMRWYLGGYREPEATVVANCYAVFSALIRKVSTAK